MRRLNRSLFFCVALFSCAAFLGDRISAAEIPGLFNTGVDNAGVSLADNDADTHYELIAPSNVLGAPIVATSAGGFPIGPWVGDSAISAWITPSADTNGPGNDDTSETSYTYRTTFDLTGFDVSVASITGRWSSDNAGLDILFNGVSTGQTNPAQFAAYTPFEISTDFGHTFVAGINTIDFLVNNAGAAPGPSGVRVEMSGIVDELPPPPPAGLIAIDSLFSTGVDENGAPLAPGALDSHWNITESADPNFIAPGSAIAQQNHPAWAPAGLGASYISTVDQGTTDISEGTYIFETSFDLDPQADPASVVITGEFLVDNGLTDVLVNGVSTGINGGNFGGKTPLLLDSGFVEGTNILTFIMLNAGNAPNPGGMAVDLSGTAIVPEPSSIALICLGLISLVIGFRRRR